MQLEYLQKNDDGSALSSPRTWFETPPSSPSKCTTGSAITTPGSIGSDEYCISPFASCFPEAQLYSHPRPGRYQAIGPRKPQDTSTYAIQKRRKAFLKHIQDVILPLLGENNLFGHQSEREVTGNVQIWPYAPIDLQPAGLQGTLKGYQIEGLSWLLHLRRNGIGGILADDMGLGKTLQTLSLFQHIQDEEPGEHKFLIVCPLSVLDTWMSEISKWTTGFIPLAYHGSSEDRQNLREIFRQPEDEPVNIVVTSYETVCNDLFFFRKTTWAYVVLYEGHRIKNSKAKRTQGIYKLRADYKLVLTGTPIQNDMTELWSILHWLYPDVFTPSTAERFEDSFSLKDGRFDSNFVANVTRFLKLVMLRRTKTSPEIGLNIPTKKEIILSVPLTECQLDWYHKILTGVEQSILLGESSLNSGSFIDLTTNEWERPELANAKRKSRITTNTLMELRKCSVHPYLLVGAIPQAYEPGRHLVESSGKFIVLEKMIHQFVVIEQRKIIIFSGFTQALNLCEDVLGMGKFRSFKHVRLDGGTSAPWRNLSVFLFQNDPRYKVFLLSIRAGGEGLNLISASTVIFLDDDWNPQSMRQAESRVHRIGQTEPVNIYRLHSKGTVEDQMRRRLAKKSYLADRIIDLANDIHHPINLDETAEDEITLMPNNAIVPRAFSATDLDNLDLDSIMESCSVDEINVQEMSFSEKKAWLERSEAVKTNLFNGKKVDTSSKSVYESPILEVSRASRRTGKSRVIMVGEFEVLKGSIVSATSPARAASPKAEAKAKKENETVCFICHRRNATSCETCTRSFHARCLDRDDSLDYYPKGTGIICPLHYCCECGKSATEAGGLLFGCLKCPRAYCENCLDWNSTKFVGENPAGESRGYSPRNVFFIECGRCASAKRSLAPEGELAKRARRC